MSDALEVPATLDGERVDRAVALLTGWSRAEVQALIVAGSVLVDGAAVAKSRRLVQGEHVELLAEPEPERPPEPEQVPVAVVYEDADVLVVDKPAGLVVHPGAGHPGGTLVNGLLGRFPEIREVGDPLRPGIVHRLDRDTSGLLLVARTQPAYERLVAMLAARSVGRRYAALVWGVPDAPRGVVDAPIGRSQRTPTRMAVREGGRDARTGYETRRAFDDPKVALLACTLETGRTHQIRVHLAAIRHPVVGDPAYGGVRPGLAIGRPFLHAERLALEHPVTGAALELSSPLPPDLGAVLDELDARAGGAVTTE
jgi:23S rRNA pseudouridine1911/1915/1917 synthase